VVIAETDSDIPDFMVASMYDAGFYFVHGPNVTEVSELSNNFWRKRW
jgi:hypothetical protein